MNRILLRFLGVCLMVYAVAVASTVAAQTPTGQGTVQEIRIEGSQRIEPATVRSYLKMDLGDPFDPELMDRSLKSLFSTGLFADVTLRREGDALVVRVVENPIINRISFEGNVKVTDETLMEEVQLRPRVVYTRTKVQNDVKRILEVYRRTGRFAATVEPKVISLPDNRVDLVFEIDEGEVTRIQRISFIGNRAFSDGRLRSVIMSTETAWWKFLTSDDTYDPDRLAFDRELLRRFYTANGYADFRVVSAVAELAPSKDGFYLTFTLEEGERYRFGKIEVSSSLRDLEPEELLQYVTAEEGEWYNADEIEESINNLTDAVGTLGYAFVDVRPRVRRNREKLLVDVTFEVQEGPRVYVERINITGNTRTLDEVIRREIELAEGDAFNTAKIRNTRRRIKNLGFFEDVEIDNVPGSKPDTTIVNVNVTEQPTGELSLGAGFSSEEGAIGDFGIQERNFLGRGQNVKLNFVLSQRSQQIDFSFTEPYFLDRNISAGIDIFRTTRDFDAESSFQQSSTGFSLRAGYWIAGPLSQSWRYTLRRDTIENVSNSASVFVQQQEGATVTSAIGQDLVYDLRDSRLDPTEGYFFQLSTDFAGLGGSVRFLKLELEGGSYWPLAEQWVLSVTGETGIIFGLGQDVRIVDRFFLGGESLRGFEAAGVGPRDFTTGDSLGGKKYAAGTVELSFPLGLPEELGILGKIFVDAGTLTGTEDSGPTVVDSASLRLSAGVGVSWRSPFGPVRVDLAEAILKEDEDKTELIRFSFGTRF